ncbi:MAG: acyl carrier protein [Acidimicrobiia bacterium]|jgi:acyl carrier protein|nr:acyl carrier protein [Acidimicrobiia bacterium]
MTPTIATIKQILATIKADPDAPSAMLDDADIVNDVGLDSLELLQFMLELEARLSIRIDFERLEYEHLSSIRILADVLDTMAVERPSDATNSSPP